MDISKLSLFNTKYQQPLVKVTPNTPVMEVIYLMNQTQTSCVLILEQEKLLGIFTKTDLVRSLTTQVVLVDKTIRELMSKPVITLSATEAEDLPTVLRRLQQHRISHLPIINEQRQLSGIVTPQSIQNTLLQACDSFPSRQLTELLSQQEVRYRTSEARLNDILNSAITTSIVSFRVFSNYDWEYEYQSPGCEAIFGFTSPEIMQDKHLWMSRVHPQDLETVIMPLFADILVGRTRTVELRFYHKDGSLRWISATYTSRQDVENNCWIVTGISKDISERKQAEAALRESEERWQLAIAGTEEAIWDWDITTNQTFRSDRWFELLGYQRYELSNWDDEWSKRIHPDDYERVIVAQTAYLQQQADSYSVEYRLRRQDGNYGWFRSRAKAVWDESGNPIRLVGSLGDINDSKATEQALQEREAMLRRIGDHLPNGAIYQLIRELDGSDRFFYMSAGIEKLMEITAEDVLKDSSLLYRQVIPEDVPHIVIAANESLQHLSVFNLQVRICTPSGQMKWVQMRSTPHRCPDGRVAWDGLVVDVTDIKNNEDILRKNQALLAESQRVARLGNWEFDLATEKITWSEALFHLFGLDPTQPEPTYQENLELYHPEDRQELDQAVRQSMITGESYKLLLRKLTTDDSVTYIEGIGHTEFNDDGQVIRLYGTAQDITERIQAEEKIRHSEAKLVTTQKIAHVGSWELDLDTYQRIWSTETFDIFGLNPHQSELNHAEFLQMIHPDDRVLVQNQLTDAILHSTPFSLEYRIIRSDGSIRYVESRAEVAQDSEGKALKLIGAILDITERKQAELEIIHSRDLLGAIFNESADALFLVDTETLLTTDCNQQALKMFGASSKAELIGIEGQTLQKQQFTPQELAACVEQINQQGFWRKELEYMTKQGKTFWGSLAVKRIKVAGQDINLVRVTDITEQQTALRDRQQAEAALARSEEQLRLTFEFTDIGTWDWNVQTGEVAWNDNHYRLLGLNPATSTAQYQIWRDAIHPEDVNRVEQALLNALQHRTNFEVEYRVIHPNGSIHWLTGRGRGIYNQADQPTRMLGVIIDTSDHKRAEQALQEKEQFLRSIYDGVGQSIFVIDVIDQDFRYAGINNTHEILTGLQSNDLKGKTPEQILPADVAVMVRQHYQNCLDTGTTITYEECLPFHGQLTWWITSLTPLRDENSQIYRIVGNSIDISDRKRTEQMLELQAVIARNMAEGILLVRASDGVIVYTNPKFEQMFGYNSGELIGQHISIVNYADDPAAARAVHEAIAASLTQRVEVTYEVYNVKKDGTPFWCTATTCVFEHPEYGAVFVAVQQDITEQKQVGERIQASLKEKEVSQGNSSSC